MSENNDQQEFITLDLTTVPEGHGRTTSGTFEGHPMIIYSVHENYHKPGKCDDDETTDGEKPIFAIKYRDVKQLMALKLAVDALVEKLG